VDWYYYDQEGRNLDHSLTVLREVLRTSPHIGQSEARGALARFLIFGEDAERPVSTLSGGERSRVSLAKMFLSGANLLILDEPTNHLDIDGKEALEEALADFRGTVLMVSHDRFFIDRVATRVLELHRGVIHEYHGNYTDYLEKKAERAQAAAHTVPVVNRPISKPAAVAQPPKRRSLQYLQRQHQEMEQRIHALETRLQELETLLADPNLYADALRAREVTDDHLQAQADLENAYAEWEAVGEEIVALELEAEEARLARLSR
jgi:ATP-binding cassette subfamily F protein 3